MARKCCTMINGETCRSNYDTTKKLPVTEYTTVYRFPRPPEQERWVRSLPNTLSSKLFDKNGIIARDIGVCAKHWPPDCVKRPVQGPCVRLNLHRYLERQIRYILRNQSLAPIDAPIKGPLPLNPERTLANHEIKLLVGTSL